MDRIDLRVEAPRAPVRPRPPGGNLAGVTQILATNLSETVGFRMLNRHPDDA